MYYQAIQHTLQNRLRRWFPLGIGLVLLIALCGLANGVILHRIGPVWSVNLDLDRFQLIAGTSQFAQCPPLSPGLCRNGDDLVEKTFAVWVIRRSHIQNGILTSARRVIVYPRWACQGSVCFLQGEN